MKYLFAVLFLVLASTQMACGPIVASEATADDSDDADYFRENVQGTWNSECRGYTDQAGSPSSVQRQMKFSGRTVHIKTLTYSNYSCTKPVKVSATYNTKMKVYEATSEKDVVVEFTNQSPRDGHFVKERTKVLLQGMSRMEATVVGRSKLSNGVEVWMDESDFGYDRSFSFTKADTQ